MRKGVTVVVSIAILVASHALGSTSRVEAADVPELPGRVVAVGIPGAGAVSAVGGFHAGSPIADKASFKAFTRAGEILDCERILVASSSSFGAPPAQSAVDCENTP